MVISYCQYLIINMKKLFLLLIASTFVTLANAQQGATNTTLNITHRNNLNDKIIIDSAGTVLKPEEWRKQLNTGLYLLRSKSREADTLTLVRMSNTEVEARNASIPAPAQSESFPIGEKRRLFSVKDIEDNKIDFKEFEGKIVVLNFWFIACPPCKDEIPELNKIAAENPNIVFIAICLDQKDEIRDFLKKTPFNYRQVANGRNYSSLYAISSYPTNVVIDKTGVVRFSATGYGSSISLWLKKTIAQVKSEN
jgi:thiol-disulfide isomerase/thioredoxin